MDAKLRKTIYAFTDDNEKRLIVVRAFEAIENASEWGTVEFTPFLEDDVADFIIMAASREYSRIRFDKSGIFEDAERVILAIFEENQYMDGKLDFPISLVRISSNDRSYEPSHRNVLGTILGLGVKRDKVGDIRISDGAALVAVETPIDGFVISNLMRVGRWEVEASEADPSDALSADGDGILKSFTLKSLRLDSLLAEGFGFSRSESKLLVESGKVKVNHSCVTSGSKELSEGDLVSARGFGRIRIVETGSKSRKDRLWVTSRVYR